MRERPFLGRRHELELLRESYESPRSELVVLYGRRRIGKSRLVQHFCADRPSLEFEGLEGARTPEQIAHFTASLRRQSRDPLLSSARFQSWDEAFTFVTERILRTNKKKVVVLLDELQWMAAGRRKLVSLIKYFWDNHWQTGNVLLILCGSISSYMVDRVVRSNALYGRLSLEICLQGLPPQDAKQMFRGRRGREEILRYLLVFGGVPRYLEEIKLNQSFSQNMNRLCFSSSGLMVKESERIFYSQFREYGTYLRIVKLLRGGALSLDQISKRLEITSGGGLKRYLENLDLAEIISTYVPFGKGPVAKDKRYRLTDEYLVFYFKYIAPNLKAISAGSGKKLFERLTGGSLLPWLGLAFERFCLKYAGHLARVMGFEDEVLDAAPHFQRGKSGFQIDLLFERADRVVTLCEVKYQNTPIDAKVIPEVERKSRLFRVPRGATLERALISIHGPSGSLRDAEYFHHYVTLEDLI